LKLERKTHLFKNQTRKGRPPEKNKPPPSEGVKGVPPAHL
jgi:hypothetical protein